MNNCLSLLLLSLLISLPARAQSQQQYQLNMLTDNVSRFTYALSNSGHSAVLLSKNKTIQYIDTRDSSVKATQPFSVFSRYENLPLLDGIEVDFLSVNDSGILLATVTLIRFTGGPTPSTCGIVKLNLLSGEIETIHTYTGGTMCKNTSNASINNDGTIFFVYHDATKTARKYIYSYLRAGVKKDILIRKNGHKRFIIPPLVYLSSSGEAQSFTRHSEGNPGKLLFFHPKSGLTFHPVPEKLQFKDLMDFSGNKYLFIDYPLKKGMADDIYIYTLTHSKKGGTVVSTTSKKLDAFLRKRYKTFKKNTHISIKHVTPSGKLFSEIYEYSSNNYSFINVALVDPTNVELLVEKSRGISQEVKEETLKAFLFSVGTDKSGALYAVAVEGTNRYGRLIRFSPIR